MLQRCCHCHRLIAALLYHAEFEVWLATCCGGRVLIINRVAALANNVTKLQAALSPESHSARHCILAACAEAANMLTALVQLYDV
jgi:hypothetical protein